VSRDAPSYLVVIDGTDNSFRTRMLAPSAAAAYCQFELIEAEYNGGPVRDTTQ
jgi:hypothetical protein